MLAKLAKFNPAKKPMKYGSRPTWPTFVSMFWRTKNGTSTLKLGVSPGFVPAQQIAFFRAFILSCFRDPLCIFEVWEMKMKTDHENTKVRNHEKEEGKLDRSRARSGELFNDGTKGTGRQKPMNYGKWSNSRELARTLTANSALAC